jgi:hypothetical protein
VRPRARSIFGALALAIVAAIIVAWLGVPDLSTDISVGLWVAIVAVVAAAVTGGLIGLRLAARYRSKSPARRGLRSGYFDHVQSVFDAVLSDDVSLTGFPPEVHYRVGRAFCDQTASRIEAVSNYKVDAVMLVETAGRKKKFEAIYASDGVDRTEFDFNVKRTWLHVIAEREAANPEATQDSPLRKIDDLERDSAYGDDIDTFTGLGYRSLRTFAVTIDKKVLRVVVLCDTPGQFSDQDDNYLEMLRFALQVAAQKSSPPPPKLVPVPA